MSSRVEFRVVWKREGRQRSTRIFQSWAAANRKAMGVLALEAVKAETTFETLPDLEQRPVIEMRPVGDWVAVDFQPGEPLESSKREFLYIYGKPEASEPGVFEAREAPPTPLKAVR